MIYERFIFITTYAIVSSTAGATESDVILSVFNNAQTGTVNEIYTEPSKIDDSYVGRNLPKYQLAQAQNSLDQQTEVLDSSISLEPPQSMSRAWSWGGILAIALITLFVLWSLFKKPPSKPKPKIATLPQHDLHNSETVVEETNIPGAKNFTAIEDSKKLPDSHRDSTQELNLSENELNLTIEELAKEIYLLELIKNLQQDDLFSKRNAVKELAQLGNSRAIAPLAETISEANSADKSLVLSAIANITQRSLKSINHELFTSLQDKDPEIRKSSIRDLTTLYEFMSPMVEQLTQMQLDKDLEVQQTAKQAMKKLNLIFDLAEDYPENGKKNSVFNIFNDRDAIKDN